MTTGHDLGSGNHSAPREDMGQDPIINVALAYGFADNLTDSVEWLLTGEE